jgi:hypothetical protein
MRTVAIPLLVLFCLAVEDKPAPKVPIGKETTHITGPIDKDGYIDYETALNERLSKGITPATNANVLIWKALGPHPEGAKMTPAFFKWLGDEPPEKGDYFFDLRAYVKDDLKLDMAEWNPIFDQQTQATQRPWKADDYPHIASWLKANEKPLAVVVEAARRPDYFSPVVARRDAKGQGLLIGALLPAVQKCRELCTALAARAMLRTAEGKFADAWQDLLSCHRLGRLVARGPTLIESLVGIAIDTIASRADVAYLATANLPARKVRECLRDLDALPPLPVIADKIDIGERFIFLDILQAVRRGGVGVLESMAGGAPPKLADPKIQEAIGRLDWTPAFRNGNRWFDRVVAAMRQKDHAEQQKEMRKIDLELRARKKELGEFSIGRTFALLGDPHKEVATEIGDILICLLLPAFDKVQSAADRAEQVQRNLRVAVALAAYHADEGRYPATLEPLAPRYLPAIPGDIFSGKALIYRPSENGYLLYSVGVNGKDEGGRWFDDTPPGDDPSVRIPLPERKPPK